ncbi:hypothetical protein TNCT_482151 [Trichonephila clavata]|uniref:Uncharacterized protein n=1 Tax=Trichonephila clavata TaxID=2740835 RepID=A0A8X6HFE8_TRICU|nr:hypothetical protein TNCT_482151 [Trichonephila clavata]
MCPSPSEEKQSSRRDDCYLHRHVSSEVGGETRGVVVCSSVWPLAGDETEDVIAAALLIFFDSRRKAIIVSCLLLFPLPSPIPFLSLISLFRFLYWRPFGSNVITNAIDFSRKKRRFGMLFELTLL